MYFSRAVVYADTLMINHLRTILQYTSKSVSFEMMSHVRKLSVYLLNTRSSLHASSSVLKQFPMQTQSLTQQSSKFLNLTVTPTSLTPAPNLTTCKSSNASRKRTLFHGVRCLALSSISDHSDYLLTEEKREFLSLNYNVCKSQCLHFSSKKSKSKKAVSREVTDSDSDDNSDDDDDDDNFSDSEEEAVNDAKKDWKDLKMNVPSLRIDAVLSAGLGVSRKKIEEAFLNAKLRHNGKKVLKKSKQVQEGDLLDVLKSEQTASREGGDQVIPVMRVEIKKIKQEKTASERTPVKLRRWKHLELPKEK